MAASPRMTPRHHLNRFLEAIAIPHLALVIVLGQVLVFMLVMVRPELADLLPLVPARVLGGEWWRLFTYVLEPVSFLFGSGTNSYFTNILSWLMVYFIGTALEGQWGTVRFNTYFLIGWVLTTAVAFLVPGAFATNAFFIHSVFLAFAFIAPDFEMLVMFILPVKAKWLALAQWLTYALLFVQGGMGVRLSILAAVGNFLIFFWRDILLRVHGQGRRMAHAQRTRAEVTDAPRHTCLICGKNSNTHPDLDFRYCSKCAGDQCYCPEHIRSHEHVLVDKDAPTGTK